MLHDLKKLIYKPFSQHIKNLPSLMDVLWSSIAAHALKILWLGNGQVKKVNTGNGSALHDVTVLKKKYRFFNWQVQA